MTSGRNPRRRARKPQPFAYFANPTPVEPIPPEHAHKVASRLSRLMLLGSFGVVTAVIWLSLQYLLNPDVAFWLDHELFGIAQSRNLEVSTPQTLSQVQTALDKAGLTAGQPIVLRSDFALQKNEVKTASDIAMPISTKEVALEGCSDPCQTIRQIRIYRSLQLPWLIRLFLSKPYFRLTDVIPVRGPTGADLLALDQNPLVSAGSDQPLPITLSEVYNPAPEPGLWLRLSGIQSQGSSVSTYGQVYYFDPRHERLNLMTNWVSPPGEVPQWQQVTGDNVPELVVNQTVGLEPQYAIYRLKMADGVASVLQAIALTEPVLQDRTYLDALTLAKSGLWTPGLTLLTQAKQDAGKRWNKDAQAQFDYIQLHARVTQAQANQPSASTVQRIMGYLVNGSWTPALEVLQSDRAARGEVREMLLSDTGRLGNRIDTALKVMPGEGSVVAWGALLRMVRGSEAQALAWTQKQAGGKSVALVQKLFKLMNQSDTVAEPKDGKRSAKEGKTSTVPKEARSLGLPTQEQVTPVPSPVTTPVTTPEAILPSP